MTKVPPPPLRPMSPSLLLALLMNPSQKSLQPPSLTSLRPMSCLFLPSENLPNPPASREQFFSLAIDNLLLESQPRSLNSSPCLQSWLFKFILNLTVITVQGWPCHPPGTAHPGLPTVHRKYSKLLKRQCTKKYVFL